MGAAGIDLACGFQQVQGEHLLAEIAFIQWLAQDDLIDFLQIAQAKLAWQQAIGDIAVFQLALEPVQPIVQYGVMVEGQGRQVSDGKPGSFGGIG